MYKIGMVWTWGAFSILAILLPPLFAADQQSTDQSAPSPPGTLMNAGGHRLHINCQGKGSPTVVMEAGAGDFSFDWSLVQPEVARFTRACAYDRAGYAWSDPGPTPRTMRQIVTELHAGLLGAGIKGPYVLVGHSLGGLLVRVYASQYPKEVAGIVLIDSSHEDMLIHLTDQATREEKVVRFRELSRGRPVPPVQPAAQNSASPGKSQEARPPSSTQLKLEAPFDKLPLNAQRMRLWAMSQPNYTPARISEFDFLPEELARLHADRGGRKHSLGSMPLIVLTRRIREYDSGDQSAERQLDESHKRLQADLTTLSNNSKQIVAKNSGHHIHLDEPGLVVDAIRQVVNASRRRTKLVRYE
ncbi:MAG TPA: alpha/beta hydrolase [Blastocatellia bacterium]|nr:alpha/beta hydrolase [Blastocatellia bacterium]